MIVGIDEVGRGCLAGPVVAAAVVMDPRWPIEGLADSKALTAGQRERLAVTIMAQAIGWSIGRAEASEIDRINILHASLLAMVRAFAGLTVTPRWARVDGNRFPDIPCPGEAVVRGDKSVAEIAAASILAKVHRDREMAILDALYPGYAFGVHKAYPTRTHLAKLDALGASAAHRRTFGPVAARLGRGHRGG